jgi:hypothetical protein
MRRPRRVEIDVEALAGRLGADHSAMHDDLAPLFRCQSCAEAGRQRIQVFLS